MSATAGTGQVALAWTASAGATGYHVKRATTSGGPYTQIGAPTGASYADTSVNAGTAYYYVVSALNPYGESADSSQASATPTAAVTTVTANVDVLTGKRTVLGYLLKPVNRARERALTER